MLLLVILSYIIVGYFRFLYYKVLFVILGYLPLVITRYYIIS
jgi:hypothetical protein